MTIAGLRVGRGCPLPPVPPLRLPRNRAHGRRGRATTLTQGGFAGYRQHLARASARTQTTEGSTNVTNNREGDVRQSHATAGAPNRCDSARVSARTKTELR